MNNATIAAVFHDPGSPIEFREVALPALRGSEILVEVVACTLCGSDLHSLHGRRSVPTPTILGHEILGRIAEFGPKASRRDERGRPLSVGDRVTWGVVASCGDCFYCRRRLPQKCERGTKYGHEPVRPDRELTGGLAGYCVLVPGSAIFLVPDHLSDAVACPANCATATVASAMDAAGPLAGARVLVMGAGMLGLTATAWARSLGAEAVIACDADPARLTPTESFGASRSASPEAVAEAVLDCTEGYGVDVAFELTGAPDAIEAALPLVRVGGVLILIGSVCPTRAVPVVPEQIVRRCLTVRGIHNYRPRDLEAALDFLGSASSFPFDSLVSEWQPLSALESIRRDRATHDKRRIGIRPGG
ncbi:MAG: zinc-binding dehydrogenase [Paludisphaera borealis]|uniref:zinc-binding dehydrogenase n=1 Tax=Paludisphaera borealis TaxID=1387353 RepID=UPI002840CAA1|nr:zinc-binding dehydrogenase [Paludisphaera borealis]MDR3621395.1 zinc-binding dehydrogenase [Paludisphaera borealis]